MASSEPGAEKQSDAWTFINYPSQKLSPILQKTGVHLFSWKSLYWATQVISLVAAQLLASASAATSATASATRLYGAAGQPNFSGLWDHVAIHSIAPPLWGSGPAPLTPAYAAKYKAVAAAANAGRPIADTVSECKAVGMPYLEMGPGIMEVIETPGQITMIQESGHEVRRIYTDGRAQDPDADAWFDGHSVGHWDGKTLVVDVTNIRPETPMDGNDTPHSDALRLTERWTLEKPGVLRVDTVATDPKAFTRPWKATHYWSQVADYPEIAEQVCEDNNRNLTDQDGRQGFTLAR